MVNFVLNKAQSGNIAPNRFNLAVDMANRSLFKRYEGIPEVVDTGGNGISYAESTDVEKVMEKFKQQTTIYINSNGICPIPSDFVRESSFTYISTEGGINYYSPVKICNDTEFQEAQYSYIVPATFDNPAMRFVGTNMQFLPKNLINVDMTYLRMPKTPYWAYTTVNNRPVYDATNSVDIEFPDDIIGDLVMLVVQYVGVSMNKNEVIQYSEQYKLRGE